MKKAFTLAEILVVLAIMGIVASLVSAATIVTMPKKTTVLFKRNYAAFNSALFEVANDKFLYPVTNSEIPVFANQNKLSDSDTKALLADLFSVEEDDLTEQNYFCLAIASKLQLQGDTDICSKCDSDAPNLSENFTTADGTKFYGLCGQFNALLGTDDEFRPVYIYVEPQKSDEKYSYGSMTIDKKYQYDCTMKDGIRSKGDNSSVYRLYINAKGQVLVKDEPEKTLVSRAVNNH